MTKKYLYFFGCIIGLLIFGAIIAVILIDIDQYKPKFENILTQATGIDWIIKGDIDLAVFPTPSLTINNIGATYKTSEVLNINNVKIEMDLLPLLFRNVHIGTVRINSPEIRIIKDLNGNLNIPVSLPAKETQKNLTATELPIHSLIIRDISIDNGSIVFSDKGAETETKFSRCNLMLGSFTIITNNLMIKDLANYIKKSMLSGKFHSESLSVNNVLIENIFFNLSGNNGIFSIKPITARIHDGEAFGELTIDTTSQMPEAKLNYVINGYKIDRIFTKADKKEIIAGSLDLSAQVSTQGLTPEELLHNLYGDVSIRGANLLFKKYDIDAILYDLKKSQNFSLVDLGGFLVLGPFGPLITKTYDYTNVYLETGKGESTITQIVADWHIESGIATAHDVAFATEENRIAFQGKINFIDKQFDQLKMAIIDENGCERYSQTINGPFDTPEMEEVSFVATTIVSPLVGIFKKAVKILTDGECQPFYTGLVPHPSR